MNINIRGDFMDLEKLEKNLKVLADKTRLLILRQIADGEHCGCDLITHLDITQPTLSHHLKVLKKSGFIEGVKIGQKINYQLQTQKFQEVIASMNELLDSKKQCIEVNNENI
jgi:ArsR family transcriptional regulator, arsenate/arsenite/antimonite-responsive transcriptional repressor